MVADHADRLYHSRGSEEGGGDDGGEKRGRKKRELLMRSREKVEYPEILLLWTPSHLEGALAWCYVSRKFSK